MCDAERHKSRHHDAERRPKEPESVSQRMLFSFIPHSGHQAEARDCSSLSGSKNEPHGHKTTKVLAGRVATDGNRPGEADHEGQRQSVVTIRVQR